MKPTLDDGMKLETRRMQMRRRVRRDVKYSRGTRPLVNAAFCLFSETPTSSAIFICMPINRQQSIATSSGGHVTVWSTNRKPSPTGGTWAELKRIKILRRPVTSFIIKWVIGA